MKTDKLNQTDIIEKIIKTQKITSFILLIGIVCWFGMPISYVYFNSNINNIKSQIIKNLGYKNKLGNRYKIDSNSQDMNHINKYFSNSENLKILKQKIKRFSKKKNKLFKKFVKISNLTLFGIVYIFTFCILGLAFGFILFSKRDKNQKLFLSIKELSEKEYNEKIKHYSLSKIYKNLKYISPLILSIKDKTKCVQILEDNKNIYVFNNGETVKLKDEVSVDIDESNVEVIENVKI